MASASDKDEVSEVENNTAIDKTRPTREHSEANSVAEMSPIKEGKR